MGDSTASSTGGSRRRVSVLRRGGQEPQDDGPGRICHCGITAHLFTSWTEKNPGRRFFGCRNYKQGRGCRFFKWLDDKMNERSTEVINELLGYVDKNPSQTSGADDRKSDADVESVELRYVESEIAEMHLEIKQLNTRLRVVICALVLTWVFLVFVLH